MTKYKCDVLEEMYENFRLPDRLDLSYLAEICTPIYRLGHFRTQGNIFKRTVFIILSDIIQFIIVCIVFQNFGNLHEAPEFLYSGGNSLAIIASVYECIVGK